MSIIFLITGCFKQNSPNLKLSIAVEPYGRPGAYKVSGNTNLPDKSKIEVLAIRYLQPIDGAYFDSESQSNDRFSILARQYAEVAGGKWDARLNLWQVDLQGYFREPWQMDRSFADLARTPDNTVSFLAIVNPDAQSPAIERELEKQIDTPNNRFLRFASNGQWYVQTREDLALSLPTDKTRPPVLRAEDINGGWGDRSRIRNEPASVSNAIPRGINGQTNAPLSSGDFIR